MGLIKMTSNEDLSKYIDDEFYSLESGIINVIVGWSLAKEMGASILNHKIDEKTYWTFTPTEKRKIFLEHMEEFKINVLNTIKSDKTIININPLEFENKEGLLKFISEKFHRCSGYLFNDRLYIYNGDTINHLDVGLLSFMSWDIIKDIEDIVMIKKLKDKDYKKYLKYLEFKYIPYLIDAEENTFSGDVC